MAAPSDDAATRASSSPARIDSPAASSRASIVTF